MPRRSTRNSTNSAAGSTRKFGVEIEFTGIGLNAAARALSNAGLSVDHSQTGRYTHRDSASNWKVVHDGSVSGGGEAVSPILSGADGYEQVRKAARALSAAGATANRSCGLHVHVNARDLTVDDIKNTVENYSVNESTIDSFMPRSRRGNINSYCYSNASRLRDAAAAWNNARSHEGMQSVFHNERFMKVNLESLNRHGSIEFRQHSGTVQASKIIPWVQFCVNLVEQSRGPRARVARSSSSSSSNTNTASGQLRALQAIVARLNYRGNLGSSLSVLADAAGVTESSAQVYISKLRTVYGFGIKKNRSTNKYYMTRQGSLPTSSSSTSRRTRARVSNTNAASERSAIRSNIFHGLPADVVSYFRERTAELAS